MLVKYEKAKERNSKKETIKRPDLKKQKNNKDKDSEPKWAGTVPLFKGGNIQTTEQLGKTTIEDSDALKYT